MLASFCDDQLTDKNTLHSYVDAYEDLFKNKRYTASRILEIGIGPYPPNGGSIKMWASYFPNAQIHATDIIPIEKVNSDLYDHPRIYLHTSCDAYNKSFFTNTFSSKNMKFDIMIDDGPHTLESMIYFITMYWSLLKEDGIMVVEDVQNIAWIDILRACTPEALKPYIEVQDRRNVKGRYDDILFIINKSRNTPPRDPSVEMNQYKYE
jgi:hypothetical protein